MFNFLTKNKKYLCSILIAAILFNFLFSPLIASAQNAAPAPAAQPAGNAKSTEPASASGGNGLINWISGGIFLFASSVISSLLGAVFGVVLWIEAQIIDYILSPTNFSFTNAIIVQTGWHITRDLANMFFILILLIIAFATVLRIQTYAIQQLWWKILVAALLINFSLVIAGFVIDFTQILTTFFIKQALGGGSIGTITTRLASSMQILNFYNPSSPQSLGAGITQFGASAIAAVIGIILTLIGLIVTVFVFGATAVFLIVRIIWIWGLLIFAPIIWMLWILPATSKYFSQWWDKFIQWSFFAPIYVFMIYLSLSIFDANGKLNPGTFQANTNSSWTSPPPGLTTVGMPQAIFQWILVIAMMFSSLIIAQKFGVEGAKGARSMLEGWGTSTKNWAGRFARRKATAWIQPLPEAKPGETPPPKPGWFRRTGAAIGGAAVAIPGVRFGYQKMLAGQQKTYQDSYNKYKNIDPAILKQTLESGILLKAEDKMALQSLLIEKGKLKPKGPELIKILDQVKNYGQESTLLQSVIKEMDDDMHPEQGYDEAIRTDLIKRAKIYNLDKPFRKFFPVLASQVLNKDLADEMKKIDNLADIYEDQLVPDVVNAIPTEKLRDFLRRAPKEKKDKIKIVVDNKFKEFIDKKENENSYTYYDPNAIYYDEKEKREKRGTNITTTYKKMVDKIASETHRDTRNRMMSDFMKKYAEDFKLKDEDKEKLTDSIRRKFAVESQIWDTTI
jgi:hypothetical protein